MLGAYALKQHNIVGAAPAVDTQLVRYAFTDGSGSTLTDSSGNGYNGTITNATWSATSYWSGGSSLAFDNNTDYVTIAAGGALNSLSAFTLEFWLKIDPENSANSREFYTRTGGGTADQCYIQAATNKVVIDLGSVTSRPTIVSDRVLASDKWYHIVATWDSAVATATQRLKLYIDGIADTATASTGSGNTGAGYTDVISYNSATASFEGNICYFASYSSALSAATVLAHYNTGLTYTRPNVIVEGVPQLLEEIEVTTACQWREFAYPLNGDSDGGYRIEIYAKNGTTANRNITPAFNGVTNGNRSYCLQTGASTRSGAYSTGVGALGPFMFLNASNATYFMGMAVLEMPFSKTGSQRFLTIASSKGNNGTQYCEFFDVKNDVTSPGPSVNIVSAAAHGSGTLALGVGTMMRLWKLNNFN